MDTATHCLIGTFTYSLLPKPYRVKHLLFTSIILANFPDIDVFFSYTQELYLTLHRGITHSLILAPIISLILAYILLRFVIPKNTVWKYTTIYAYVLLLFVEHLYADVITNYGTMIFLPLSSERIRIPAVFIIDIVIIALLIIGIIFGLKKKYIFAYIVAIFAFCYPLMSFAIGSFVEHAVYKRYLPLLSEGSNVVVYPAPFAPVYWNVIIEDNNKYYRTRINVLNQKITSLVEYNKPDAEFIESLKKQGKFFNNYVDFADTMLVVTGYEHNKVMIAPLYFVHIDGTILEGRASIFEITLHSKDNVVESIELFPVLFPWCYTSIPIRVKEPFSLPTVS